uniref:AMP-dependent synthetase/ligase domain-containing protein n=1 Tax=Setaria italica TaxID=4555 RepID=K4AMA6_SETIT
MDSTSGFCPATRTLRSLRPPEDAPVSFPSFALSRLPSPLPAHPAFADASTGAELSFAVLPARVRSLATALRGALGVAKGNVALVLAPPSLDVPVVYLAVLSLGATVSSVSPLSTATDVARAVGLCNPSVVFATAATVGKVPAPAGRKLTVILLDSPQFESFLHGQESGEDGPAVEVRQSDVAAINYSSGTTGRTKAVAQSHRRLIASALQFRSAQPRTPGGPVVTLLGVPMSPSYGFHMLMRGVLKAETTVVVTAPCGGAAGMASVAAMCRATQMFVAPPVVVAMAPGGVGQEGFPDLVRIDCGGAPLSTVAASAFQERFPGIELSLLMAQLRGGLMAKMIGHEESCRVKSTGYVGGNEANVPAFDSDGWLKAGDHCYFDEDGFLYIVDRLKEVIKYKAYQLEDMLHLIPGLLDVAVVPYPDQEAGQLPMAFVVRQKGSNLTEDQIIKFVAKQ